MKLYAVRHGESEANAAHVFAGWARVNLTELGRQQAREAGRLLQGIPFDRVFSSDLPRAVQTAQEALPGRDFERLECLREINVGAVSGKPIEDCVKEYGEEILENRRNSQYRPYGGENWEDVMARVRRFMQDVEKMPCENIAVFAHAGTLRTMLDLTFGMRLVSSRLSCKNCTIAVFEYLDGHWRLNEWKVP